MGVIVRPYDDHLPVPVGAPRPIRANGHPEPCEPRLGVRSASYERQTSDPIREQILLLGEVEESARGERILRIRGVIEIAERDDADAELPYVLLLRLEFISEKLVELERRPL